MERRGDLYLQNTTIEDHETYIHPSAQISPTASIGRGACIRAGVVIGEDIMIGEGVEIDEQTVIKRDDEGRVRLSMFLPDRGYYTCPETTTENQF